MSRIKETALSRFLSVLHKAQLCINHIPFFCEINDYIGNYIIIGELNANIKSVGFFRKSNRSRAITVDKCSHLAFIALVSLRINYKMISFCCNQRGSVLAIKVTRKRLLPDKVYLGLFSECFLSEYFGNELVLGLR